MRRIYNSLFVKKLFSSSNIAKNISRTELKMAAMFLTLNEKQEVELPTIHYFLVSCGIQGEQLKSLD